jgi:hypothetical protein
MDICRGGAGGAAAGESPSRDSERLDDFSIGFARMASMSAPRKSGSIDASRGGADATSTRADVGPRLRNLDLLSLFRIASMSALRPPSPTFAPGGSCAGGADAGASCRGIGGGGGGVGGKGGGGADADGVTTTSGSGVAVDDGAMGAAVFVVPDQLISAA